MSNASNLNQAQIAESKTDQTINTALASNKSTKAESKRELRKRELRSRIIEASMTLFAERGFTGTTIDDICENADVARRTLYSYFATKNDIIQSLCRSLVVDENINAISLATERHEDLRPRLQFLFARMRESMDDANPLQKALIEQLSSYPQADNETNTLLLDDLKQAYVELFSSASDMNGLSKTMGPELSAVVFIALVSALSINWIKDPDFPLNKNIQELEKYLLNNLE